MRIFLLIKKIYVMGKLRLKKEVLSSLDYDAMKRIQGGGYCDPEPPAIVEDITVDCDLFKSRVCGTYFKTGGCSGANNSKSCAETVLLCIPT